MKDRKITILGILLVLATLVGISSGVWPVWKKERPTQYDDRSQTYAYLSKSADDIEDIAARSAFDGRLSGWVTPVKNQGDTNLCWAYSSIAASETSILRTGITPHITSDSLNLNPLAAAYRMQRRQSDPLGNTDGEWKETDYTAATGNPAQIATLFSCWWGPVSGEDVTADPFDHSGYRLENAVRIPEYKEDAAQRITAIKRAIAEYGAVTFQYNNAHNYEYYNPKNEKGGDSYPHACTLIGWNDNIPAESFQPGGATVNGGWLVKNSYSGLPDGYSYFYLSYDNTSSVCYAFSYADCSSYDRNYYYDGGIDDFSLRNDQIVANIYQAVGSDDPGKTEQIKAINVGVNGEDYTLEVEIRKNLRSPFGTADAPIAGGESVLLKRQSFRYGGYVTIRLDEPVALESGEWFSVIVRVVSGNAAIRLGYKNGKDLSYVQTSSGYSKLGHYVGRIKAYTTLCDEEKNEDWNFTNLVVFARFNGESEFVNDVYENTAVRNIIENTYSKSSYSVRDYFDYVSGGKVKMKTLFLFDGNGSVTLSRTRGYYAEKSDQNPDGYEGSGADRTVDLRYDWSDALNRALNAGNLPRSADGNTAYRISDLDKNGDGKIDCITVIYKNPPSNVSTSWASALWNYQDYTSGIEVSENGNTYVGNAYVQLTFSYQNNAGSTLYRAEDGLPIVAPSVICHETLHVFGLKDLYRSDQTSEIGFMSVMGRRISPIAQSISAKEAEDVGFINEGQIKVLTQPGTYSLQVFSPSDNGVVAYKLDLPGSEMTLYLEYRDFDLSYNKYDYKNKTVYYCGNGNLSAGQKYLKSGLVCYMVKTGMRFPSNLHTSGKNWNYYVVSAGIQPTKIDCALAANDYLDLTDTLNVEVLDVSDGTLTFSILGGAFDSQTGHQHRLVRHDEVGATCFTNGRRAHYKCADCGGMFRDPDATQELREEDLLIPAAHKPVAVAEVEATCFANGRRAHYKCADCGGMFRDPDATQELREEDLLIPAAHKPVAVAEVGATCFTNGRRAHYKCADCGGMFRDPDATQELREEDLLIPAAHKYGEWQNEKPSTEDAEGIKGHKDCLVCEKHFDRNGNEIVDLKIPQKEVEQPPCEDKGSVDQGTGATVKNGCADTVLAIHSVLAAILPVIFCIKRKKRG